MRALSLVAASAMLAGTALGAAPAFAQASAGTTQGSAGTSANGASMRAKLQQDLSKAGFTNITVMPEAFAVHATNSSGQRVFMLISPDSVTEITPVPPAQNGTAKPPTRG